MVEGQTSAGGGKATSCSYLSIHRAKIHAAKNQETISQGVPLISCKKNLSSLTVFPPSNDFFAPFALSSSSFFERRSFLDKATSRDRYDADPTFSQCRVYTTSSKESKPAKPTSPSPPPTSEPPPELHVVHNTSQQPIKTHPTHTQKKHGSLKSANS